MLLYIEWAPIKRRGGGRLMWLDCDADGDDIQSRDKKGHGGTKTKKQKTKKPENGRQRAGR